MFPACGYGVGQVCGAMAKIGERMPGRGNPPAVSPPRPAAHGPGPNREGRHMTGDETWLRNLTVPDTAVT